MSQSLSGEKGNKEEATAAVMELPDMENWHYKVPVIVDTGDYNRTDCVLSQTINISREIGGFGTFDENSVRVIETLEDGTPQYESVSQGRWVNKDNLDVTWLMNGTTPANTQRYYSIYFDIQENGIKNATTYPGYVTTKENSQHLWIYSDNYEIKIDKDRGGSRELKVNNVPRKGYTLDKDWMSWYTPHINWDIKGASTTLVEDGPVYKTVKIISSDNTQTVYWYFYPDKMKIVTEEEYDPACFDTIADELLNTKGTLVWNDYMVENFTKDYQEYSQMCNYFYILDPELDSANDDVKGRSGFWADTVDGKNQTVINACAKGTRWILNGSSAWFGFTKNEEIGGVVLRSQNPPIITRECSWIVLESPVIEDKKVFENQVVIIKGDLTVTNTGTLVSIDSLLIVHGNITVEEGGEIYIVSSRDLLPPKPPELPPWPPLPPRPPRPPIRPPIRSAIVTGNIWMDGKLFVAKDTLSMCSEKDGMNGIHFNPISSFECYDTTITAFSGEIPVSITNQKMYYEKSYYRFDIYGEAQIDSSKISYLSNGVRILNGSDAVIQNCEIFKSKGDGIYIVGKTKPVIANNTIRDCSNAGVFIFDNGEEIWTKKTEMNVLPEDEGWTFFYGQSGGTFVSDGILTIPKDFSVGYRSPVAYDGSGSNGVTAQARIKLSQEGTGNVKFRLHDRFQGAFTSFDISKNSVYIHTYWNRCTIEMNTYSDFHTYTMVNKGLYTKFYIDGELKLTGKAWNVYEYVGILFGSKATPTSYWDYVYYSTKGAFEPGYYPPTPIKGASPWSIIAAVDEVVEFDASNYYDPATIANYSWDFDASNGIQKERYRKIVNHTYENAGIYFVTLTVTDNVGATDSCYVRVSIWDPTWWSVSSQTISNCKYGFNLSDTSLNIAECNLFNNDYGVYCKNSSAAIITSYIFGNSINSVYVSEDSSIIPINAAYDRTNVSIEQNIADTDNDGWKDKEELYRYGFSPYHKDSADADFDNDSITNIGEAEIYGTDPLNPDTDGEGLNDWDESMIYFTNALNPDTDFDGLNDKYEVDTTYSYSEIDWNGDGNIDYKTNPLDSDTDDDGINDGDEVNGKVTRYIVDKRDKGYLFYNVAPASYDKTFTYHTNPLDADTEDDGQNDYNDPVPLDYDMDGDGYINRDWLIDPTGVFYVERIAIVVSNDPYLNRYANGDPVSEDDTNNGGDNDIDGDGITDDRDDDMDNDGMKYVYEVEHGVIHDGWQHPFIYNARYALLIGGGALKDKDKKGEDKKVNYPAFENDLKAMYDKLKGYNYLDENIYCFLWNKTNSYADWVDGPAIWERTLAMESSPYADEFIILDAFEEIGKNITENDFFYFAEICHGGGYLSSKDFYFDVFDVQFSEPGVIYYDEKGIFGKSHLSPVLDSTIKNYARSIFVMSSCGCGYAIDQLQKENRIVISSVKDEEDGYCTCWWDESKRYDTFAFLHEGRIDEYFYPDDWDEVHPGFIPSMGNINNPQNIKHAFDKGKDAATHNRLRKAGFDDTIAESKPQISNSLLATNTYL